MNAYGGLNNHESKTARESRIARDKAIKSGKKAKVSCAKAKSKRKKR